MNYEKLKTFRLWDVLDKTLSDGRFSGNRRVSLYPSEASVICKDPDTGKTYIEGGCHRKSIYRMLGFSKTNPPGPKGLYIFEFGKYLETMLIELTKKGFVYDNNSVKFWDKKLSVSGEIDIVVRHPEGGIIFVEVKSSYGTYKERELFGAWGKVDGKAVYTQGSPSTQNLLQIVTYLWNHKDMENLVGGKLIYILRDNMSRIEFDITIDEAENGLHRVFIDGKPDNRFYVEDIIQRYEILRECAVEAGKKINAGMPKENIDVPPRDYSLLFTDEEVEDKFQMGLLGKTKYNAFQKDKNERPGDFQCGYCDYKDLCWKQADIDAHLGKTGVSKPVPKRRTKTTSKTSPQAA
jgi:hypothetical protein